MSRHATHFLTFGGGYSRYRAASHRLGKEASRSGVFARVEAVTDKDLARSGGDFAKRNARVLRREVKGFGYWIWKPYLIGRALASSSADYVMFLDAGCVLNLEGPRARARFDEYHDLADERNVMAMQLHHVERVWCKVDTMDRIGLGEAGRASGQTQSGVLLVRNSSASRDLIAAWLEVCCEDDYRFVDDSPSTGAEASEFREHRHDQAILSCLCKVAGVTPIPAETHYPRNWTDGGKDYPIWTARHRWGSTFHPGEPPSLQLRLEQHRYRAEQSLHRRSRAR